MGPHAGKNINMASKYAFDKDGLAGDLEVHTTERASVASASTWRFGTLI